MHSATISQPVELTGRGLFSAMPCRAVVCPATAGSGLRLLLGGQSISLTADYAIEQPSCTVIGNSSVSVAVVEHLLAALWAAGIDTAQIEVEGPELPNRDGSSLPMYEALQGAGTMELDVRPQLVLDEAIFLEGENGSYLRVEPDSHLSVEYHFAHPELGTLSYSAELTRAMAPTEILPARSFITETEAAQARELGLLNNEDPNDALVFKPGLAGQMQPVTSLRFPDEMPRHKVLDLLGDTYLAPVEWTGRITAHRSGHRLNRMLARRLLEMARAQRLLPAL